MARAGSFAGGAEQLFLTPSAVSQQMAVLERQVGTVLFERGARGVRLTPAGKALAARADAILTQLRDAMVEVEGIAAGESGQVALGSFPTASSRFTARAVAAFRSRNPRVEVRLVDGEPCESIARLKARQLDLAVVFDLESWPATMCYDGSVVADEADVELLDLCDDPFMLLVPRAHPLARSETVELRQLTGERFMGSSNDCAPWGMDFARLCRGAGFEPNFEAHFSSVDFFSLQAFVAAGLGLTLLPALATGMVRDDVVVLSLEQGPVRRVKIALPTRTYRSPATTAVIEALRA
ncbi:MAG: LysR family transcriptional regulator, partial [Acidimicrobiia bacterium]|nr:LysR family transcriptional regulator [Acidimicrobiia bacterium]